MFPPPEFSVTLAEATAVVNAVLDVSVPVVEATMKVYCHWGDVFATYKLQLAQHSHEYKVVHVTSPVFSKTSITDTTCPDARFRSLAQNLEYKAYLHHYDLYENTIGFERPDPPEPVAI